MTIVIYAIIAVKKAIYAGEVMRRAFPEEPNNSSSTLLFLKLLKMKSVSLIVSLIRTLLIKQCKITKGYKVTVSVSDIGMEVF